jgi:hypothetical protein
LASALYKVDQAGSLHRWVIQDSSTGTTSTFTLPGAPRVYGIEVCNNTASRAVTCGYNTSTGVVTISGLTASDSIFYTVTTD